MSDVVTDDDRALLEKLAVLLSHMATMTHGPAWDAVLAEHGYDQQTFLAAYGKVSARFASEPALAEAYGILYQRQTDARFREAAAAKGLDADPRLAGSQWNTVHDIGEKAAGFARPYAEAATTPALPGYTPNLELIARVVVDPSEDNIATLLGDLATVFHIDWREEPLEIIGICGQRVPDGLLELSFGEGGVTVACGERTALVELTEAPGDREAILRACHRVLLPDYEIRVCRDSLKSDTLSFVCLAGSDWSELERSHGARLGTRFAAIEGQPLFE